MSAYCAERRPGLLAVRDVMVALADGPHPERCKIRPGAGLRVALAPPVLGRENARQVVALLPRAAELHDHRRHHAQAERYEARGAGGGAFLVEEVLLDGGPARAAVLDRPVRGDPALRVEDLLPADVVVLDHAPMVQDLRADVARKLGAYERAHLRAERLLFRGVLEVHRVCLAGRDVILPRGSALRPAGGNPAASRAPRYGINLLQTAAFPERHKDAQRLPQARAGDRRRRVSRLPPVRAAAGRRPRRALRRQLLHRHEGQRRASARQSALRGDAARRDLPALRRGRRDLQLRLPGLADPLPARPGADHQDERARRDQHARARQAAARAHPAGLDERGVRRPRGASAARELLGASQPDRPARVLRRGQALRRDPVLRLLAPAQARASRWRASSTPTGRGCTRTTAGWSRTSSSRRSAASRSRSTATAARPARSATSTTSSRASCG